jgi:NADPH:quinone reductase-like Zn-dependent oxidoreductase
MKAICITSRPKLGELGNCIELKDLPMPEPGKNEIRIKVIASTINIDDVHIAEGTMFGGLPVSPKPSQSKPYIPGTDVAGIIDAVGQGVNSLKVGQEVYGICNMMKGQGPWAEYCIAKSANVEVKPEVWDFKEAAACAVAGAVAVSMVNSVKDVRDKKCLVIGASGGIGTLCVQALRQKNAKVWGVCSQRNVEIVQQLGAERVIDYTKASFSKQIQDLNEQVDVVFDLIGGKDIEKDAFSVLASTGAFVTVVGPNKYVGEKKIGMIRALSSFVYIGWRMLWTRIRTGPNYIFTGPTTPDFESINMMLVASGSEPVIDTEASLTREDISAAIKRVISHRSVGKVIVNVKRLT